MRPAALTLLSLRLRLAVPTREGTAASKTREGPSQQPSTRFPRVHCTQHDGFWRKTAPPLLVDTLTLLRGSKQADMNQDLRFLKRR